MKIKENQENQWKCKGKTMKTMDKEWKTVKNAMKTIENRSRVKRKSMNADANSVQIMQNLWQIKDEGRCQIIQISMQVDAKAQTNQ